MNSKTFGQRVWGGDNTTVAEAEQRYENDPENELIRYAMTLYSFRNEEKYAGKLLDLRNELLAKAKSLLEKPQELPPQTADMLSTYLEWLSRHVATSWSEGYELKKTALSLCEMGIESSKFDPHGHTPCLLRLTQARLYLNRGARTQARTLLRQVWDRASRIEDPQQRARVFAKMGMLYRQIPERNLRGIIAGIRACCVWDIPKNVRLKCVAALLGIDG